MGIVSIQQDLGQIYDQMTALTTLADTEKRDLTADENQKWEDLDKQYEAKARQLEIFKKQKELDSKIAERNFQQAKERGQSTDEKVDKDKQYSEAFYRHMRYGNDISLEERQLLNDVKLRAQVTTTPASGGYLVPTTTHDMIIAARLQFNPLRSVASVFTTPDGGTYNMPTNNDTSNEGEIIGENVAATETDLTFAQVQFGSYLVSSRAILVSNSMLQDDGANLESYIASKLGERIGRAEATNFTVGNGTTAPQGIVTGAADSGVTAASSTTVTYAELVNLMHSVDPAYRDSPNCRWMFHDTMLSNIKKLVDTQGRPLWMFNIADGQPATILGKPYVVNQAMAEPATTVKSILFGDMSNFMIRDVRGFSVKRNDQLYMNKDVVAFFGFERIDSKLVNAGTNPITYLDHT